MWKFCSILKNDNYLAPQNLYMYCVIGKSVLIKSGSSAAVNSVSIDPMKQDVAKA